MLKHRDPNPLNVHQMRRLEHLPPHFSPVLFELVGGVNEKTITDWVWENLEGRFYYGVHYSENDTGNMDVQKVVAFELPSEASYFALILDTVNKYNDNTLY